MTEAGKLDAVGLLIFAASLIIWSAWIHGSGPSEQDWQTAWCEGKDRIEYRLNDGSRIDCLTDNYAIEIDFGRKWAEAIGQSLYYGAMSGRQPGIVLIIQAPEECRFFNRLQTTIQKSGLPIHVWTIPVQCGLCFNPRAHAGRDCLILTHCMTTIKVRICAKLFNQIVKERCWSMKQTLKLKISIN